MLTHETGPEPRDKSGTDGQETQEFPILLVEDSQDDLILLQLALKKSGVRREPYVVRDGADAINYLAGKGMYGDRDQFPFPYLVLLDLSLPRRNGLEVLEWWSIEPRSLYPRIIILTGSVVRSDIERAYQLGAASYLLKSGDPSELAEMIKRTLEFWSLARRPTPRKGPGMRHDPKVEKKVRE